MEQNLNTKFDWLLITFPKDTPATEFTVFYKVLQANNDIYDDGNGPLMNVMTSDGHPTNHIGIYFKPRGLNHAN